VLRDSVSVLPVFADSIAPDAQVATLVARYRAEVATILDEVVGEAETALTSERRECPMGNLVSDVMRDAAGATFAFTNPGGLRASIDAGPITYSEVYEVMPFDNTIVVYALSGLEVIQLLEQAASDGSFLHASGLRYAIDASRPSGSRITVAAQTGGKPIIPDTVYPVAVNSFMAQGGDGLSMLVGRPDARETGILIRNALLDRIRAEARAGRRVSARVEQRISRGAE
jgi:5'-nucleotidase